MKTKLEMAHDFAMNCKRPDLTLEGVVSLSWKYVDAMQAEADNRSKKHHDFVPAIMEGIKNAELEEWQPDWSKKTNDELRMLVKTLDGIIESRSDCNHEWDHISAYGGGGNYYVCSCGAEKHTVDEF